MGEAKQLPRIAGRTVASMGSSTKGSGFHHPFVGNMVPPVVPMYIPKNFRRPGDVYYKPISSKSSRQSPRPLGLIPDRRQHVDNLPGHFTRTLFAQLYNRKSTGQVDNNLDSRNVLPMKPSTAPANRLKPLNVQYRTKSAMSVGENVQSSATKLSIVHEDSDPDYMDILSRLSEPHYLQSVPEHVSLQYVHEDDYHHKRRSVCLPVKFDKQRKQPSHNCRRAHSLKPNMEVYDDVRYDTAKPNAAQYINFVEQASMYKKQYDTDKRDGLDYIPCERCRLRGGRCSNCKTIRIGGGYIILDGENDGNNIGRDHSCLDTTPDPNDSHLPILTDNNQVGGYGTHNGALTNGHGGRLHHDGDSDDERRKKGQFGQDNGRDGKSGRITGRDGFGTGQDNSNMHNSRSTMGYDNKMAGHGSTANNTTGLSNGLGNRNSYSNRSGVGLSQSKSGTGDNRGDSNDDLTGGLDRTKSSLSNTSRPGSSQPVSSRPASRISSGVGGRRGGYERKNRKGGSTSMEKQYGGHRKKRSGDEGSNDSDSDDETKRRRRKKDSSLSEMDENANNKDKGNKKKKAKDFNLTGHYSGENSEPEQKLKYRGSLYKFQSKEDNVKALKCTLKELQGIDPLDYLAKYCIIDQSKLPNYQRVYDNVDRDEDDEIDITELDFALKAVNYDLISDAEVDYVNQILELSSRYKLNFHLFSVIAALSEKVVALEDMVKKLINKMDLKALETKMKKCKELFYLLDDMDSGERDGVVTVASLAVELQAGGLTEEHVEFVVDRLNHEQKGLVEFLDYLTYVPLFVEIHDSVCGNPLDFSRTK